MEQSRAKFIKSLLLGATSVPILVEACNKSNSGSSGSSSSTTDSTSTGSTTSTSCSATPSETPGPYPYDLSSNSAIFPTDIKEGNTRLPLSLTLPILNSHNSSP